MRPNDLRSREKKRRTSSAMADAKRFARSRLGNGSIFPRGIDQRSSLARRYKELYTEYTGRCEGKHTNLVRQLCSLILQREILDERLLSGESVDLSMLTRIANEVRRTMIRLRLLDNSEEEALQARLERERREDEAAGLL